MQIAAEPAADLVTSSDTFQQVIDIDKQARLRGRAVRKDVWAHDVDEFFRQ